MNKEEISLKVTEERLKNVRVMAPFLKNRLNLPDYLKFGFEIEALINEEKIKNDMIRANNCNFFDNENFRGVSEIIDFEENEYGGFEYCVGGEIVTPILSDREESWLDIKRACDYLLENGKLSPYCSVHTNIGVESLGSDYKNWYNFCKIIAACEPEIYRYLSNGEEIRPCAISGGHRSSFAMPIANELRRGLEKSTKENVTDINTLLNNCKFNGGYQYKKDKSISLKGIYKTSDEIISHGEMEKSTEGRRIEFRMANGTFSPEEIQNHLYVISRIIETARTLTPQKAKTLDELLSKPLPKNYNLTPDISRVLDVANILFDNKEDKLQFLFTVCRREKEKTDFISDKDELMRLLKEENMVLEFASNELKSDREVVLEAVKRGGAQIQYASEDLRGDKNIALIAVRKYGRALQYLSKELRNDREVVLEAIKNNGLALEYASENLKCDKELVLIAARKNGFILSQIGQELQADKEVVFESVKNKGSALQYASEDLRADRDIVLEAIKNNGSALLYASEDLRGDKQVVLEALKHDKYAFRYASENLRGDKQVVLEALKHDKYAFRYASEILRGDKQVVLEALKYDNYALSLASKELREDISWIEEEKSKGEEKE